MPLRGGGGGRLMANAILNFHFDFPHPSLSLVPVIIYGDHRLICRLKIKADKNDFLRKGGGYFALASLLSMEWCIPSVTLPLLASSQAWNPEPCQTLVLQTHLYTGWHRFILLVGTLHRTISTQGGANLDDMAVDNVSYSLYDDILPPLFSLPLPRFHQKSEASCWVGWRWNKKRHNFQWHRHCHCHCQKWWGRYGDNGWRDLDTSAHCDDTQAMWAKETKHESQHLGILVTQWHQPKLDQNPELISDNSGPIFSNN